MHENQNMRHRAGIVAAAAAAAAAADSGISFGSFLSQARQLVVIRQTASLMHRSGIRVGRDVKAAFDQCSRDVNALIFAVEHEQFALRQQIGPTPHPFVGFLPFLSRFVVFVVAFADDHNTNGSVMIDADHFLRATIA
jgi:hypothetical protein